MQKKIDGIKIEPDIDVETVSQPVHILLKVRSEIGQTINAHADMVAKNGEALFAKMGKQAIHSEAKNKLNKQIESGVKTYLFLTTREGWNGPYVTYRCLLRQVHDKVDKEKQALIPQYYSSLSNSKEISTWFEITTFERLTREEMNRIFVLKSQREIMSVVNSSATVFYVGVK